MKKKKTLADVIISTVIILIAVLCLLPFMNVIAESFSGENVVIAGEVGLLPKDFTLSSYRFLMANKAFFHAFGVTVFVTTIGTCTSLMLMILTAYPLSLKNFRGGAVFMKIFVFAMLFLPGLVPSYMMMKLLHILNTPFVLIVPGLLNIFNLFIMRNFMQELPAELAESAKVDGASNFQTLFQIIVPLCKPVLATLTLFLIVTYWNDFMTGILYISKQNYKPLQHYLYELVNSSTNMEILAAQGNVSIEQMNFAADSVRSAAVVLSTIPIMCVYPFLQKYFVKGLIIGAVKG